MNAATDTEAMLARQLVTSLFLLGASVEAAEAIVAEASACPAWSGFAALDAAIRRVEPLVACGRVSRHDVAGAVRELVAADVVVPVGATEGSRVDVRVIAATDLDWDVAVSNGTIRKALAMRLGACPIHVPPVSERRSDLLELWRLVAPTEARELSVDALEAVLIAPWEGGVRELRHVAARAHARAGAAGRIELQHLPKEISEPIVKRETAPTPAMSPFQRPTRDELAVVLARCTGQVSLVAAHFGRTPKQVYRWMDTYGIARARRANDQGSSGKS